LHNIINVSELILSYFAFLNRIACTLCMRCGLLLQMLHVAWSVYLWVEHTGELCENG